MRAQEEPAADAGDDHQDQRVNHPYRHRTSGFWGRTCTAAINAQLFQEFGLLVHTPAASPRNGVSDLVMVLYHTKPVWQPLRTQAWALLGRRMATVQQCINLLLG